MAKLTNRYMAGEALVVGLHDTNGNPLEQNGKLHFDKDGVADLSRFKQEYGLSDQQIDRIKDGLLDTPGYYWGDQTPATITPAVTSSGGTIRVSDLSVHQTTAPVPNATGALVETDLAAKTLAELRDLATANGLDWHDIKGRQALQDALRDKLKGAATKTN